jgi:hypothetical protein
MINSPPFSKLSVELETHIKNGWMCKGETWIQTTEELHKLVTGGPNCLQVSSNAMSTQYAIQMIIPYV